MGFLDSINISASALTAERLRMDVISNNIANANTTRTEDGLPYRRRVVVFQSVEPKSEFYQIWRQELTEGEINSGHGVRVAEIALDNSPFRRIYDPTHPDAGSDGYVQFPNVNVVTEMVDLISATRAYEANVTSLNASKSIVLKALEIGRS
ncbi:MAG: flagellar basal body rod protein FlgC [Firmicutes bacterium]|nr:flagellar basal body rod protein FlgC [Bacillota bacterium]